MTVYEKLLQRLSPIGIYTEKAEELHRELKAYAAEIERLYSNLSTMFRERFITTAENEGLRMYEELFGPVRDNESVENRRQMLQLRMGLGNGDFTLEGIKKALDSLGLQYVISEFPALGKLNITATADYSAEQQAWIQREVGKMIPASIEFQLTFNTLTWAQWDAFNRTFDAMDNENQTWQEIDNRTK